VICSAKDIGATFISIITSFINFVAIKVDQMNAAPTYVQGGAGKIDSTFNAMSTMVMTSLNFLLNQILLILIYPFIVMHKVMVCQVNGILAMISEASQVDINIGNAKFQEASDKAVGVCLTEIHAENLRSPSESEAGDTFSRLVNVLVRGMIKQGSGMMQPLDMLKHVLDAGFSWVIGVLTGIQDTIQSADLAHCKLPDFYMRSVYRCACNDAEYLIPQERAVETYATGAFWCSGTLNMMGTGQNPVVVFNPFSYAALTARLEPGLKEYLGCISGDGGQSCESIRPRIPELEEQGVSSLAVLTRCKANYAASQWDEGSAVLFLPAASWDKLVSRLPVGLLSEQDRARIPLTLPDGLQSCMVGTFESGQSPDSCLVDIFLLYSRKQKREDFFSYVVSNGDDSRMPDACEVFTGPIKNLGQGNAGNFDSCTTNDLATQCNIPPFVWSGRSTGKVPVASYHSWEVPAASRVENARADLDSISASLSRQIMGVLNNLDTMGIEAQLFSAEGDALHQLMDCIFMGPYASMDYGAKGYGEALPVQTWSRRSDGASQGSRAFELPCSPAAGGDTMSPFTCGSETRRAVIKYFVRSYAPPIPWAAGSSSSEMFGDQCQISLNTTVQDVNKERVVQASCICPGKLHIACAERRCVAGPQGQVG